jgi:lipopolysaccharide export LptBFGC system permease protein LptF
MRVLSRAVLTEVGTQFAFFAAVFIALIALGVATPLVKQGAPVEAVAGFLVDQSALFSMLALPLALVTAVLTTIGRMREEGELTALQAAGISTWAVARALLPLSIGLAVWLAIAAHLLLPHLTLAAIAGRDDLMRQAIAAQVGRRQPIVNNDGVIVSANAIKGDTLSGVFGALEQKDGSLLVCYSPSARLVARPEGEAWVGDRPGQIAYAGLQLDGARLLISEPGHDGQPGRVTTGVLSRWVVGVPGRSVDFSNNAEVKATTAISAELAAGVADPKRRTALQLAWHVRWMLPVAALGQWLFACGLGLAMGRGNRLVAAVVGIVVVVGNLALSYAAAKELALAAHVNPGWFVWPPSLLMAAIGAWLLWRHR